MDIDEHVASIRARLTPTPWVIVQSPPSRWYSVFHPQPADDRPGQVAYVGPSLAEGVAAAVREHWSAAEVVIEAWTTTGERTFVPIEAYAETSQLDQHGRRFWPWREDLEDQP